MNAIGLSVPIILRGQSEGGIKEGDPLALAIIFWGAVQGIGETLGWYPDAPLPEPEQVLDILKK